MISGTLLLNRHPSQTHTAASAFIYRAQGPFIAQRVGREYRLANSVEGCIDDKIFRRKEFPLAITGGRGGIKEKERKRNGFRLSSSPNVYLAT
jgi:hypothetical protein